MEKFAFYMCCKCKMVSVKSSSSLPQFYRQIITELSVLRPRCSFCSLISAGITSAPPRTMKSTRTNCSALSTQFPSSLLAMSDCTLHCVAARRSVRKSARSTNATSSNTSASSSLRVLFAHMFIVLRRCRYCCSVATFFCFGTTHFCNGCHQNRCAVVRFYTVETSILRCPLLCCHLKLP